MAVPLLDLRLQYAQVKDDVQRRMSALCDSQQFILGAPVEELETAVRDYTGCSHAIGGSSGTDALLAKAQWPYGKRISVSLTPPG